MKKILYLLPIIFLSSCFEDDLLPGGGSTTPYALEIRVTDAVTKAVVPNATVDVFATLDNFLVEQNAVVSGTTDANGIISFDATDLENPGIFYVNVASGDKRNWQSTTATKRLTLTAGTTVFTTVVADVLPQFIALAGNRFALTGYSYPGNSNVLNPNLFDECLGDDELVFLKTGRVMGYDTGVACESHFKGFKVAGFDWSAWSLQDAGASITIRDLDPDYNTANPVAGNGLTISEDGNTVTIDYGGGYAATLVKI